MELGRHPLSFAFVQFTEPDACKSICFCSQCSNDGEKGKEPGTGPTPPASSFTNKNVIETSSTTNLRPKRDVNETSTTTGSHNKDGTYSTQTNDQDLAYDRT
ncbi:unnamed protein product [Nippostrongylus brasiliensis]|uniref:Uncharacterized protein n=1 Tax=Nippostrongylus brasiliensis TaxID=27835 RepID=A0A0N4YXI2_NIPBR|nr:unnamed protein product [Nippostrongylus brasiliensis]